jgi:hypothetical protein
VPKQIASIVAALAMCLVGCLTLPEPVQLITGPPNHDGGCFAAQGSGLLVVDPTDGTAIVANDGPSMLNLTDVPLTVAWPPGFTARRSGAEVEVLDPQGNVVATTGRSYTFMGGFVGPGGGSLHWPELKKRVIWACGEPLR